MFARVYPDYITYFEVWHHHHHLSGSECWWKEVGFWFVAKDVKKEVKKVMELENNVVHRRTKKIRACN